PPRGRDRATPGPRWPPARRGSRRAGAAANPIRRPPSGGPRERGEMTVVALAKQAEGKAEALHLGLLRPGQRQPAVGRMSGIVDVERLARAIARRHALDLEAQHARDVGDASQAVGGEIDRLVLDAAKVLHQVVADYLRRAAGLAAHDLGQGAALRVARAFVDDAAEHPAAVGHDAAGPDDEGELQAVEGNAAMAAAIDAVDHERVAMLMRRLGLRVGRSAPTSSPPSPPPVIASVV